LIFDAGVFFFADDAAGEAATAAADLWGDLLAAPAVSASPSPSSFL
jgi:hypothetical protein